MKALLVVLLLLTASVRAEWMVLKPTEFEPLTSLPWSDESAPMDKVLGAIFREPDLGIRYWVLAEYLRKIPAADIGKAFEMCVLLEGTQNPDNLVALFIPIGVERDPLACWEWVQKLFHVVGIENGVLGYDSWSHPKITVQDLDGIRASPFWIEPDVLKTFPVALDVSSLAKEERVKIMKEFAEMWFRAFSSWPGYWPGSGSGDDAGRHDSDAQRCLNEILSGPISREKLDMVLSWTSNSMRLRNLVYELAYRRMLRADPATAAKILKEVRERKPSSAEEERSWVGQPSDELLLVWAKSDLPGMVRWVESLDASELELSLTTKGLLMGLVDVPTRERWLAEAKAAARDEHREAFLFATWAQWDLEGALNAAPKVGDPEALIGLANLGAYGPWSGQPWNGSRDAFRVLSTFDFSKLPPKIHQLVFDDCYSLMEQWDSMDVAAAARFGFTYLRRTDYAPREGLIQFFSGKNIYGGEDGMIDRTFCALRVWAVVKPEEMKKWIATIKDAKIQKALTWLLDNPWGTGEAE